MGLAFKKYCTDLCNSKVMDILRELERFGAKGDVFDPWIEIRAAQHECGVKPLRKLLKPSSVVYDINHVFKRNQVDCRL